MDLFSFIIGTVLGLIGLSTDRILKTFRFLLSCITAYIIMELNYDNLKIWNLDDYTETNLLYFWRSNLSSMGIFLTIVSLLFFYWILPLILSKLIEKRMENKIRALYASLSSFDNRKVKYILYKFIRRLVNIMIKYNFHKPIKILTHEDHLTYNQFSKFIYTAFATVLHLLVCILLVSRFNSLPYYLMSIAILTIYLAVICISPMFNHLKDSIMPLIYREINRNVR